MRDTDGDGVPDITDCRPFDPTKHGIEPSETTWKRIEALPIFYTDEPIKGHRDIDEIKATTYRLREGHKPNGSIARQRFLSIIKHYPQVLGEIERKKPLRVYVTSKPYSQRYYGKSRWLLGEAFSSGGRYRVALKKKVVRGIPITSTKEGMMVIRLPQVMYAKKPETKWTPKARKIEAETALHELAHLGQYKKYGAGRLQAMYKGKYRQRPLEMKARRLARQRILKSVIKPITQQKEKKMWKLFSPKRQKQLEEVV